MNGISINDNIQADDLELKLKESTSLSEDQIKEIIPVILGTLSEIKDLEKVKSEVSTKQALSSLTQSIENNTDVSINMKNNKWTVIWAMNLNTVTNNISITINTPAQVAPQKPTQQTTVQQVAPQKPTQQTTVQQVAPQNYTHETVVYVGDYTHDSVRDKMDIKTPSWYLYVLNQLLDEIEDTRSGISKKWQTKAWKETMRAAKQKLNQYEKQIKAKKRALEKQTNGQIFDTDVDQIKKLKLDIDTVRQDVSLWQWWEFSSDASFLYNSPENAKKSNKAQERINQFEQKMKEEIKQWAILNIFNWHEEMAIDFYRKIAEWRYTDAEYNTYMVNAWVLNPSFQRCGIRTPILSPSQMRIDWWRQILVQSNAPTNYRDMDRWETFQKWWLSWIIDKALSNCNNMTPGQRNTWKSLAVLWGVAAWLFWLYKFYTNKKMWFWGKALTTGGVILWSQILTWENPISLFGKLMTWWFTKEYLESKFWNAFGDAVSWVWNSWIEASNTLTPAMYSMMIFNSNTNVWDVRALRNRFKQNDSEWQSFRWDAITKLKTKYWDNSVQHFSATFSDKFDEEKWNNWLWSFWVTDSTADNKNIYELANNAAMNEIVIEKYRSEHGVKETKDAVKKKEFEEYVKDMKNKNQPINIEDLEAHPEWFELDNEATYTERPVDVQFKESLVNQTESLWINEPKKSELKTALKRFYDERTVDSKPLISDFSLKMDNDLLVLVSHSWQETKIDINKNEVVGLWNGIRFANLSDLLNVADLTNKILESQKWKVAVDYPPFQYKWPTSVLDNWVGKWWRWIYFNDAEWWSINFDTRVLSSGWWGIMGKIGSLWNHPEEYADYLSRRRIENNTVKIESTLYPMVKILSDSWIVFTREQEVKELEIWLKWIKEKLKVFKAYPSWNPFSIWTLSRKLEFKAINWDVQEFPENISDKFPTLTLVWNKEKFLKTINNPSNKMRWSVI